MSYQTRIHLRPELFGDKERTLVEHGELVASVFRYDSGVEAVRVRSSRGEIVVLPFHGQQVWDARFDGKRLTMQSRFPEPRKTREYLQNYGAFVIHCGVTAMGNPSPEDSHPLHGELPSAPYESAFLAVGDDAEGAFMAVGGRYHHTVAFGCDYAARPQVCMRAARSVLSIVMEIENLARNPMELMYLAHVNFRPIDNGRLVYSAPCTPQTVRVRTNVPSTIHPPAGYAEFLQSLAKDPSRHEVLKPDLPFDPEVVMMLSCKADSEGWARSMMVHPDGYASYIGHRTDTLDHAVRWISRTVNQDCLGLLLPATAEADGYRAEKAKGNIKMLAPGATMRFALEAGLLPPDAAKAMEAAIVQILGRR
jgi:hypothetical protein